MTQPKFAPIALEDEVRSGSRLAPPRPWVAHRPGEFRPGAGLANRTAGVPGPDQGYALRLARRFVDRVELAQGEQLEDVLVGATYVALVRAALYGRAPVSIDLELALTIFGYLAPAPVDLVAYRREYFAGASHHYDEQRELAHLVPVASLRLTPVEARARLANWRELLGSA